MYTLTKYQAKYYAHLLTRKAASNDREKLMGAILDAKVEPKPHQIDAALFAFRNPFSKGAILADEVGLGKTIEAGIILSQYWAEHKRKLLIIVPANLRQQWAEELREKFYLKSTILDSKRIKQKIENKETLFNEDSVCIISYDLARRYGETLAANKWDLLVVDEAHRLRNVYKNDNVTANAIKDAFQNIPKLLLTATPLQNSLLELYGLVSIIDKNYFGNFEAFKEQYVTSISSGSTLAGKKLDELRSRLVPIANRSLRKQVQEYINYTNRRSFTQKFMPSKEETYLYDLMTEYLGRDELYAFSSSQRTLITLLLLKLLGSSSHAIAVTLDRLAVRVEIEAKEGIRRDARGHKIFDVDIVDTFDEELEDSLEDGKQPEENQKISKEEVKLMLREVEEIRSMAKLARSITYESKGKALLVALKTGFAALPKLKANKKALIFTESTRTQEYLYELLSQNGYKDRVVKFNGSGGGPEGTVIHAKWYAQHKGTDKVSGIRTADQRAALVDYFKDEAEIMVATEAAGEGINLQFCSMVINYDLPWNPQRVEQRIGRCHRYGQKSDVIVINFLNEHNRAEQRILELLSEKFQLFSGVFGASDQILGAIQSGFDFERQIADIIRTCRTTEQIEDSFNKLQNELSEQIDKRMKSTRKALLDNVDSEVVEKLKISRDESEHYLSRYEEWLWELVKYKLADKAEFETGKHAFQLQKQIIKDAPPGRYYLNRQEQDGYKLRLLHPLCKFIIESAKVSETPQVKISFNYSESSKTVKALKEYIGQSGTLTLQRYAMESHVQIEEHYMVLAITTSGKHIPQDIAGRLLELPAAITGTPDKLQATDKLIDKAVQQVRDNSKKRDSEYLSEEGTKLDAWAADMRRAAKAKITKLDKEIRELKKQVRHAEDVEAELETRQKMRKLERRRDELELDYRHKLKEIDEKTDSLLDTISANLKAKESINELFTIEWELR